MTNKLVPATISMFNVGSWLIVKCMLMTSSICSWFCYSSHAWNTSIVLCTVVLMYFFVEGVIAFVIFRSLSWLSDERVEVVECIQSPTASLDETLASFRRSEVHGTQQNRYQYQPPTASIVLRSNRRRPVWTRRWLYSVDLKVTEPNRIDINISRFNSSVVRGP
jgi:hypothetical protein